MHSLIKFNEPEGNTEQPKALISQEIEKIRNGGFLKKVQCTLLLNLMALKQLPTN